MEATLQPVLLPGSKSRNQQPAHICLNSRLTWVLSAVHLSVAAVCIGIQVAMVSYSVSWRMHPALHKVFHGFWCGAMFLATGIVGIIAAKTKYYCTAVGYAVMSLISVVFFVLPLFGLSLAGFIIDSKDYYWDKAMSQGARLLLHTTLFSMAVLEALAAIYSAVSTIRTLTKYDKQSESQDCVPMLDRVDTRQVVVMVPGQDQRRILMARMTQGDERVDLSNTGPEKNPDGQNDTRR